MKRTIEDIRSNLDFVGCDNETAADLCAEIERLRGVAVEWEIRAEVRQQRIVLWKTRYDEAIGMVDRDKARALVKKFETQDELFAKQFEEQEQ